jgi:hypothetical protein
MLVWEAAAAFIKARAATTTARSGEFILGLLILFYILNLKYFVLTQVLHDDLRLLDH